MGYAPLMIDQTTRRRSNFIAYLSCVVTEAGADAQMGPAPLALMGRYHPEDV